jgi:hypothetical protein
MHPKILAATHWCVTVVRIGAREYAAATGAPAVSVAKPVRNNLYAWHSLTQVMYWSSGLGSGIDGAGPMRESFGRGLDREVR